MVDGRECGGDDGDCVFLTHYYEDDNENDDAE